MCLRFGDRKVRRRRELRREVKSDFSAVYPGQR